MVVIIGVIAAIAVPRISRGAKGAGDSALRGTLAGVRNAVDMYAAEHGGMFPAGLEAVILDKLRLKTDTGGIVGTTAGVHIYGPYLRGSIPGLPVCATKGDSSLKLVTGPATGGTGTQGWVYSTDTGEFIANCTDTEKDESGVRYNQY